MKFIESFLCFFYQSSLSIFDYFTIIILSTLVAEQSRWYVLAYIPFIWYSYHQKSKYASLTKE